MRRRGRDIDLSNGTRILGCLRSDDHWIAFLELRLAGDGNLDVCAADSTVNSVVVTAAAEVLG
jgi:hypothetical protein